MAFRSFPLWVWNTDMQPEDLRRTLDQFHEQGLGGAFVHPRPGLVIEYLSDEWFALWEQARAHAESLGMTLQVYDENSYPSGMAGGHVYERNREPLLYLWPLDREPRPDTPALRRIDSAEGEVGLFAIRPDGWTGGRPMPDCSSPQTVQTFLELTHEAYRRRFPEAFGGPSLRYFFFDEPELALRWGSWWNGIPWSDHLRDLFRDLHGYDFEEKAGLYFQSAAGALPLRYDYHLTLHTAWLRYFIRPLYDWAESHGVELTGHEMEHDWPNPVRHATTMSVYRWMHAPGVDLLGFQYRHGDLDHNALYRLNLKELASVANQTGRIRRFAELHGGGGYAFGPVEAKCLADWAIVHGVNFVSEHLSYKSIHHTCKYDFPQTFSGHSPWFRDYRHLADHQARFCFLAALGEEKNRVLVLHPSTSAWLEDWSLNRIDSPGQDAGWLPCRLRSAQTALLEALFERQVDFDLGDEFLLAEMGTTADGLLQLERRAYGTLVLPPLTRNLPRPTFDLLETWLQGGGRLYSLSADLGRIDGRRNTTEWDRLARYPGFVACSDTATLVQLLRVLHPVRLAAADGSRLPRALCHQRRELDNGEVLFLFVNAGMDPLSLELRLEGQSADLLDTVTGEIRPLPAKPAPARQQLVRLELPFAGHAAILARPAPRPQSVQAAPRWSGPLPMEGPGEALPESANVLTLDFCKLEAAGKDLGSWFATRANEPLWQAYGQPGFPWNWAVQFGREILDTCFAPEAPFAVTYSIDLAPGLDRDARDALSLAVERGDCYRVQVNGQPVAAEPEGHWLEERIHRLPLGRHLQPGGNAVRLECPRMHPLAGLGAAYLIGEFSLEAMETGFRVVPQQKLAVGDWTLQGRPFYPGGVTYAVSFALPSRASALRVAVPAWAGSLLLLSLDGQPAGRLLHHSHQAVIPQSLSPGPHRLELQVIGNLPNLLGPHHTEGRTYPAPVIAAWHDGVESPRPGSAYAFPPLGLLEPVVDLRVAD